jgi:hypothetical protein
MVYQQDAHDHLQDAPHLLFTLLPRRISIKMSSRRAALKRGSVAQHRPQNVDPPTRQRDESLSVSLALSPLAIVEDPRFRGTAQAGKGRLVEDPLEGLVAPTHPFVVTYPFAGVTGRRDKTCIGGEPLSTREGADVAHSHQKLASEDRPHARASASEDSSLGTGEKTLPNLLIDALEVLLEAEDIFG